MFIELGEPVVAVSHGARSILTKHRGHITVCAADGKRGASMEALVGEAGRPGARHAISARGDLCLEADDRILRATDTERARERWTLDLADTGPLWSDPVLSPDDAIVALPLQGRVLLLDARAGTVRSAIGATDEPIPGLRVTPRTGITLARGVFFAPDARHVAISCGANQEGPSNHTLFVANAATGEIVAELVGHAEAVADAAFVAPDAIATVDAQGTVRLFTSEGLLHTVLTAPGGVVASRFAATRGLGVVLLVDREGAVAVWRANGERASILEDGVGGAPVSALLSEDGGDALVVSFDGGVGRFDLSADAASAPVSAPARRLDEQASRMEAAMWWSASGRYGHAVEALASAYEAANERAVVGYAYAAWQLEGAEGHFIDYLETNDRGVGPRLSATLLDVSATYLEGGHLVPAIDLYATWIGSHLRSARDDGEQSHARALGAAIVRSLGSSDDGADALIAQWMIKTWPADLDAVRCFVAASRYREPDETRRVLRAFLRRAPASVEAWTMLAEITAEEEPEALPSVVEQAMSALPPGESAAWAKWAKSLG